MRIGSQYIRRPYFIFVVWCLVFIAQIAPATEPPAPILVSASGPEWGSTSFGTTQTGSFTAEIDAVPLAAGADGGIGLSNGPQSAFGGLACVGRFNQSGLIDARNGGSYAAVNSIPYRQIKLTIFDS
ncbi:MAG: hypothetical protein WA738_20435 [Candidatus Angelobacter sp.]